MRFEDVKPIYYARHGSHAYGTNIETSDEDFRGIFVAPRNYYLGFAEHVEQVTTKDPDVTIFELRKFMKLAAQCNPNVVEILYVEPEDIINVDPLGAFLRLHRDWFLSKAVFNTFMGYAKSQLNRMKNHRHWTENPPEQPIREEYGLPPQTVIPAEQLLVAQSMVQKKMDQWETDFGGVEPAIKIELMNHIHDYLTELTAATDTEDIKWYAAGKCMGFSTDFFQTMEKQRRYSAAKREWDSYNTWKKSRNPARALLEEKCGYDSKHAMHLVRLTRMAREILSGQGVIVKRPDAAELVEIRQGSWPYEDLIEWFNKEDKAIGDLAHSSSCKLPKRPNMAKLDQLCSLIVEKYHNI